LRAADAPRASGTAYGTILKASFTGRDLLPAAFVAVIETV
jgi:hypothetical protein